MKKSVNIISLIACLVIIGACSSYDDGPIVSFRSKYSRIEGVYHLADLKMLTDSLPHPDFLRDIEFEFLQGGGGHLSISLQDTLIKSNFEWEFNDDFTDFRIRRYYLHKDTLMYLSLDSIYHICFNAHLPEYDNFLQSVYGNYEKWGEWGGFMRIKELSDDVFTYGFESDSCNLKVEVELKE